MAHKIFDTNLNSYMQFAIDQHIEVRITFKYHGTPVDVINPDFTVSKDGNPVSLYVLKPLQKIKENIPGEYVTTFLSVGLTPGDYTFEATGIYNDNFGSHNLVVSGSFTLNEINRVQWFIDTLRTYLSDNRHIDVPWDLLVHDPAKVEWKDGQLYDYLMMALSDINAMPPATTNFTLESIPVSAIVLKGAMYFALFGKDIMEVHNYFEYNTPVKVTFYRGREYQRLWQHIYNAYYQPAEKFKKSWALNTSRPRAIVWPRIAFRVMRPLSMTLHFTTYGIG